MNKKSINSVVPKQSVDEWIVKSKEEKDGLKCDENGCLVKISRKNWKKLYLICDWIRWNRLLQVVVEEEEEIKIPTLRFFYGRVHLHQNS